MHTSTKLAAAVATICTFLSTVAAAGTGGGSNGVPEPGTWALVGLAAVIGFVATRSKRK